MVIKKIVLISVMVALLAVAIPVAFAPCPPPPCCPGKVTGGGQIGFQRCADYHRATFGFNIQCRPDGDLKGELEYIDHFTGMNIHIHEMLSLTFNDLGGGDWCAIFTGIDVYSGETVQIHVHDLGEPGTDDFFEITLAGYTGIGDPILHGNIQIHL